MKDLPPAKIIGSADPGVQDRIRAWKKDKDPFVSLTDLLLDAFEEIPPAEERRHRASIYERTKDGKWVIPECFGPYDYTTRVLEQEKKS